MRASALKTERRYESTNNRSYHIQTYGERNDFPQRVMEIVAGSVSGSACLDTYTKFIIGRGWDSADFARAVVDSRGTRASVLLRDTAADYATFGGFALHLNYDANFRICSVTHLPFEQVRLGEADPDTGRASRLRVHPDWGKRNQSVHPFNIKDAVWLDFYDPDPDTIARQVEEAGGWNGYKGQVFYWSSAGDRVYPTPVFEAALTDMSNEEGLSNITQRNVRHNFLPAGMLIDHDNAANSDEQEEATKNELREFQGDEKAGQLLYINLRDQETAPEFRPFTANNTDDKFQKAEAKTPANIGRAFRQPPILRGESESSGFDSERMRQAYDFYNALTESERDVVSEVFKSIFAHWADMSVNPTLDFAILPKQYEVTGSLAERLGDAATGKVLEILADGTKGEGYKRAVLGTIYGLPGSDIETLIASTRA